jgi:uncharacterized protein (TIGR02270 family)
MARAVAVDGVLAPVVSAIGWHALRDVSALLLQLASGKDEALAAVGIAGFGCHRRMPGGLLARALRGGGTALRAVAAKCAGDLGAIEHAGAIRELLGDGDANVRLQAARTLARFGEGSPALRDVLVSLAESPGPGAKEAAAALVRLAPCEGPRLFRRWAADERMRPLAMVAAGVLGSPELVDALVPWMNDDISARSAGEAFRAITGADLALKSFSRTRPPQVEGDPNDDPDDPRVELADHYVLPFPSALKVDGWWRRNRGRFARGSRYLGGREVGGADGSVTAEHLAELRTIVRTGRTHHQTMAALALAQALPRSPIVETHAFATGVHPLPGWEQPTVLGAAPPSNEQVTA